MSIHLLLDDGVKSVLNHKIELLNDHKDCLLDVLSHVLFDSFVDFGEVLLECLVSRPLNLFFTLLGLHFFCELGRAQNILRCTDIHLVDLLLGLRLTWSEADLRAVGLFHILIITHFIYKLRINIVLE